MMGCSFEFDLCACYKGDVKYCDEGWFCWSKELYWASKKESFWDKVVDSRQLTFLGATKYLGWSPYCKCNDPCGEGEE